MAFSARAVGGSSRSRPHLLDDNAARDSLNPSTARASPAPLTTLGRPALQSPKRGRTCHSQSSTVPTSASAQHARSLKCGGAPAGARLERSAPRTRRPPRVLEIASRWPARERSGSLRRSREAGTVGAVADQGGQSGTRRRRTGAHLRHRGTCPCGDRVATFRRPSGRGPCRACTRSPARRGRRRPLPRRRSPARRRPRARPSPTPPRRARPARPRARGTGRTARGRCPTRPCSRPRGRCGTTR